LKVQVHLSVLWYKVIVAPSHHHPQGGEGLCRHSFRQEGEGLDGKGYVLLLLVPVDGGVRANRRERTQSLLPVDA
jgi:hypothetical protein